MSTIAELRTLVDFPALAAQRRAIALAHGKCALASAFICPACGHNSVHFGPHGRYCERGECEWEAHPTPPAS